MFSFHVIRLRRLGALCCILGVFCAMGVFLWQEGGMPVTAGQDTLPVPVLMYHHVLEDESRLGDYVISPQELEGDLQYLKEQGYETILPQQLVDWCQSGTPLPEKPVMLTFDDGYLSSYAYVLPLLQKYGAKATFAPVGIHTQNFTDTPDPNINYAHMTWDNLKEMSQSPLVEVANHSYDMHHQTGRHGTKKRPGESEEEYTSALKSDLEKMQQACQQNLSKAPTTFVYPFGQISKEAPDILKEMGFTTIFTCAQEINYLSGDPEELLHLGRFNRPHGMDISTIFSKISSPHA